jgi:CubicO group peptidase (beta-lactamase class C family)
MIPHQAVIRGILISLIWSLTVFAQDPDSLVGVWEAKRYFGPIVRGRLDLAKSTSGWTAQIGQFEVPVTFQNNRLSFELAGEQGRFLGRLNNEGLVSGHWIQPRTVNSGTNFASPILLTPNGNGRWRGEVVPLDNEWTLYLVIKRNPDGSLGAFLRNPDRNIGVVWYVQQIKQEGDRIKLTGRVRTRIDNYLTVPDSAPPPPFGDERVFGQGTYYANEKRISIYFPGRGGTYDFVPVRDTEGPGFYARGKNPAAYQYRPPPADDDGWKIGKLDEAGLAIEPIAELVKTISVPANSVHDPYIHGFLIARHGKLVVEEYFHGFHKLKPHDLRSATKSVAATLVGAVIQNEAKLDVSTRVYDLIYKEQLPRDLDARKREMTVEHLLTMSSGYDCDDAISPPRPGGEDILHDKRPPDFYSHTLQLPMEMRPGQEAVYCSINPNLLGAVLSSATSKPLLELFQDLLANPLKIRRYHFSLQPSGEPYLGGGSNFLPRDFLKFGQLMLDDGVWNGKRILSKEFVARASTPRVSVRYTTEHLKWKYGYLWWTIEYPYKNRNLNAYFASGNGGQVLVVIPELNMCIAFLAGNYHDRVSRMIYHEFVPKFILAALKDKVS